MTKKILVIGELLWDLLPDERKLGGAPANLAYRLNSLGNPTYLLTRLGNDVAGTEALNILKAHNLNTDFIQIDTEYATGTVNVFFDQDKNPDYTINAPVAYDYITWNEKINELASRVDCIAYGTLVQRSSQTASTLHRLIDNATKAIKFYDVNLRKACYTHEIVNQSLMKANMAKLNHHEAYELGRMFQYRKNVLTDLVQKLVEDFHLDICLVTLEDHGALAIDNSGAVCYSPGYKAKMEDPLGAGDAFSAAFLNEFLRSHNIQESLDAGNLLGAIVVEQKGAMQPVTKKTTEIFRAKENGRTLKDEFQKYWH